MKHIVIDMGSSRISVMAAEVAGDGKVRILSEESKKSSGIRYGFVANPSAVAFTVNELARLLRNSARLDDEIKTVCVSLNAKTMRRVPLRMTRSLGAGRLVTEKLLDEMSEACYAQFDRSEVSVYDVIPLYYELDGRRTDDPVNATGRELVGVYSLVVGNADIQTELQRCFEHMMSHLQAHEFMPLGMEALSEALLEREEREAGCALINMGDTTTTLAVYAQGVLQQLLVVPLGGRHITGDIQALGVGEQYAERLKCLKGTAMKHLVTQPIRIAVPAEEAGAPPVKVDTDFLATIIEARLAEIMSPIFKALQEVPFDLAAGIVLAGGGSKLNAVSDFVAEHTGMAVRFGNHSLHLTDDTPGRFFDPVYAQQVGMVLLLHQYEAASAAGGDTRPQNAEIEPDDTRKRKDRKGFFEKIKDNVEKMTLRMFEDENYLKSK